MAKKLIITIARQYGSGGREVGIRLAEKLGITTEEFEKIIEGEKKTFHDYKNSWGLIRF